MIIVRAPMRISLGGGGTDVPSYYSQYGGEWVSAAIDKYVYVTVHKRFDHTLKVCYSKTEEVKDREQIRHPIFREALKLVGIDGGVEVYSAADIPTNTGLGSSGSFTVALLTALYEYLHASRKTDIPSKFDIAEQACHIAMNILQEPSGKQDEHIAAYGGITAFFADQRGGVVIEPLYPRESSFNVLHDLEHNLLMFYTGIKREAASVLKLQKEATERHEKVVIESLHRIKEIGKEIRQCLMKKNVRRFGELLDVHWQEKVKRGGTTNPQMTRWYETAKAHGAIGGKIIGAGGGGFFLIYCEEGKGALREALKKEGLVETSIRFDLEGVKVLANIV